MYLHLFYIWSEHGIEYVCLNNEYSLSHPISPIPIHVYTCGILDLRETEVQDGGTRTRFRSYQGHQPIGQTTPKHTCTHYTIYIDNTSFWKLLQSGWLACAAASGPDHKGTCSSAHFSYYTTTPYLPSPAPIIQ